MTIRVTRHFHPNRSSDSICSFFCVRAAVQRVQEVSRAASIQCVRELASAAVDSGGVQGGVRVFSTEQSLQRGHTVIARP